LRSPKQSRRMLAKALRCWRAGRRDGPVTHTGKRVTLAAWWSVETKWYLTATSASLDALCWVERL
jgi:hypothetical protein